MRGFSDRERVALALFALSGAVFLPDAFDRFDFPKLAVYAVAIALAVSVAPRGRLPRAVLVAVAAGVLLLAVGALNSDAALTRLIGRPPRYEGLIGLSIYIGAAVSGARLLGPLRAHGASVWFLDWLALATIAVAVIAVLETAGHYPLQSNVARPGSLLGNASDQGAWAALVLGPLLAVALTRRRPLQIAGAIAAAVALDCSASRGAYLGGIVTVVVLAPLLGSHRLRLWLLLFSAVAALGVFVQPTPRARVTGSSPLATDTANGRVLLWHETLHLIAEHPIFGVGAGGFVDALPRYATLTYERDIGPQSVPDSPENWVLQAAAAGGLPLLAITVGLVVMLAIRGLKAADAEADPVEAAVLAGMLAGVAGYGAALLFFFTSPASTPLAMLFAGGLLSTQPARSLPRRITAPNIAACAGFGVLAVVLAAAALAEIPLRSALVAAGKGQVASAQADFRAARTLRPWDPAVDDYASYAFGELASSNVAGAGAAGGPWAQRALSATPDSTEVVADAAAIDLAQGRAQLAAHLLDDQIPNDPLDGTLRLSAAAAALVLGQREKAIRLAEEAGADDPGDVLKVAILIADARRHRR